MFSAQFMCIGKFNYLLYLSVFGVIDMLQAIHYAFVIYSLRNESRFDFHEEFVFVGVLVTCGVFLIYGAFKLNRWCLITWLLFSASHLVFKLTLAIFHLHHFVTFIAAHRIEAILYALNYSELQMHVHDFMLFKI